MRNFHLAGRSTVHAQNAMVATSHPLAALTAIEVLRSGGTAADAAVGELLRELDRLGIYDRAVVMLLSDHGEGLGEHGEQQHGMYLYRTTLQVPLLLKLPGSRLGGGSVRASAQLIDVAPTLARLAGVPVPPGLAGENLLDLIGAAPDAAIGAAPGAAVGAAAGARPIYAETLGPRLHFGWSELTSLIQGRLHLQDGPEPELFDLAADPGETHDRLAGERRAFAAMRQAIRWPAASLALSLALAASLSLNMASNCAATKCRR